jgi:hypothetical protein
VYSLMPKAMVACGNIVLAMRECASRPRAGYILTPPAYFCHLHPQLRPHYLQMHEKSVDAAARRLHKHLVSSEV